MGVVKEWLCKAHGSFESDIEPPLCPYGCDTVERVFLTPPGLFSARTSNIDSTLESLARSHGMTDISNRGGAAAKRAPPGHEQKQQELARIIRERYGNGWGEVPKGGTMNAHTRQITGEGGGAMAALAAHRAPASNVLEQIKPQLEKPRVIYRHDHENLTVPKAA